MRSTFLAACCLFGRPTLATLAVGTAVILPGAALHLSAKGCLRIGDEITTSGPYRWVRNPFYLATFLVEAGVCVVAGNPWIAAVWFPLWCLVHGLTVRREERALAQMFGSRYEAYRVRVPRFLPWRGPVTGLAPSAGFSWASPQLAQGMEYARLVRILGAPLLVFAGARLLARRERFFSSPHPREIACAAGLLVVLVADRLLVSRSRRIKRNLEAHSRGTRTPA